MSRTERRAFRRNFPTNRLLRLVQDGTIPGRDRWLFDQHLHLPMQFLGDTIENCVGVAPVPLGVATGFVVNDVPRYVPMATEERSVIAAASKGAALTEDGFFVTVGLGRMRGQVMWHRPPDMVHAYAKLRLHMHDIITAVLATMPARPDHGTVEAVRIRTIGRLSIDPMLVVDFILTTGEAMGANMVTKFAERIAEEALPLVGKRRTAAICSNDAAGRMVAAQAYWPYDRLAGLADGIIALQRWAETDRQRAITHNKGVMNGISAVALATGQDVRAVEAAAHFFAAKKEGYRPLTSYRALERCIEGRLLLPIPVGAIGGATGGPYTSVALHMMGSPNAHDLAATMAAAGLAQNFAALLSLAGEGIPEAHKRLARQNNDK